MATKCVQTRHYWVINIQAGAHQDFSGPEAENGGAKCMGWGTQRGVPSHLSKYCPST